MKRKCIGVLVTLIGLLGFAFLGVASASLVSVATKESMVAKQLTAMSVDILHAVHGGSEVPQSIDELVEMNICSKKDTIDAWGRVIELQRPSEDVIVLISRGDPAVSQKSPDISSTISCRIPVTFRLNPEWMNSAELSDLQVNSLLAQGIPTLTPAVGNTELASVFAERNDKRDLNDSSFKPNGWPNRGREWRTRWLHSDMKDVAYYYNYELYRFIVENGALR